MPIKKNPLLKECFECGEKIVVKFVPPLKNYAQKNHWGYWTEREEDQNKYKCWNCMVEYYYNQHPTYLEAVRSEKRRKTMRVYLCMGQAREVGRGS